MTPQQFESNAKSCGLRGVRGEIGQPTTNWRGRDYYSATDRHAYLNTTGDGVTHGTLRDDDPLSKRHGSITKPLADFTDDDFIERLGMKQ